MNRFLKEKFIAFTLAEMMVILALFSTIAAATLPVVTARRALDTSEMATGGSTIDPWTYSSVYNGLSYNSAKSALAGTAAVMIGGQVNADAYSLGYPQLIVKDIYGSGRYFGNHIVFLKHNSNNNTYLGGSIMMGNSGTGSIAIGSSAMNNAGGPPDGYYSLDTRPYSVAIGSYAMANGGSSGSISTSSVAIGYRNINYQGNNTVAIGYSNCNGGGTNYDVCIGSNSGHARSFSVAIGKNVASSASGNYAVAIGKYALSVTSGAYGTAIGYYSSGYSSTGSTADYIVSIGTYAGYANSKRGSVLIGNRTATSYDNSVVIGNHATAYSTNSVNGAVVVGNYAGYGYNYKGSVPVLIGNHAGYSISGLYAANSVYPVIIGYRAGADVGGGGSSPYLADVAIGAYAALAGQGANIYTYGSTFIGNYAGSLSEAKRAVCIGHYTCASDSSESVVRIAPYGHYYHDSKHLAEKTSFIGNPSLIAALDSATRNLFVGSSTYSNMLISPAIIASDVASSSIVFYANTVYGPSSTFKMFSDKNLKNNIKPAKYGLKDINKINIYEYNLKEKSIKKRQIGVIAQEMKEIIPEGVKQLPSGYYTVNADWLIFPMVNAIKELDKTFMALKSDLTKYFNEYIVLVSRVNALEKEVKTLELENKSLTKNVKVAYKKAKIAERRQ